MKHNKKSQSSSLNVFYTKSRVLEIVMDYSRLKKDVVGLRLIVFIIA